MPDDVKRYTMAAPWTGTYMTREENGEYVHADDYDAIAKRLALFEALATRAMQCDKRIFYDRDEVYRIVDRLAELVPEAEA